MCRLVKGDSHAGGMRHGAGYPAPSAETSSSSSPFPAVVVVPSLVGEPVSAVEHLLRRQPVVWHVAGAATDQVIGHGLPQQSKSGLAKDPASAAAWLPRPHRKEGSGSARRRALRKAAAPWEAQEKEKGMLRPFAFLHRQVPLLPLSACSA